MEKIYISGKIIGLENNEAFKRFDEAEKELKAKGFEVVNPMTIEHNHDKSWINYMKTDIKALMDCDAIYMLSNWVKSRGAKIERQLAIDLGMKVYYDLR